MKRLLALLLATLMVFSLVACGNGDTKGGSNTEKSVEELVEDDDSTIGKLTRIWCETIGKLSGLKTYNYPEQNFYKYNYTSEEKSEGEDIKRIYESENKRYKFTVEYNKAENTLTILDERPSTINGRRVGYNEVEIGYNANTTVVQFNAENILVSATKTDAEKPEYDFSYDQMIYTFDEKGNLIEAVPKNTNTNRIFGDSYKYNYEYDENNNLTKLIHGDDYNEYTYDENGNITVHSYSTDEYGETTKSRPVKYEKLENGNIKETVFQDADQVLRWEIYDHYGNSIERTDYNDDGTVYFSLKCKYNEEGDCIKEIRNDEYGERTSEFEYDINGIKVKETNLDENGKVFSVTEYNENGKPTKEEEYNDHGPYKIIEYTYDENGSVTDKKTTRYSYNEKGKVIDEQITHS